MAGGWSCHEKVVKVLIAYFTHFGHFDLTSYTTIKIIVIFVPCSYP